MKRTFQPSNIKRSRRHGFRNRMQTKAGQLIIKARRAKGRKKLAAWFNVSCRDKRFSRNNRLTKPSEFRKVFESSSRVVDENFIVLYRRNNLAFARIGIVVSGKNISPATARNRIKRIVREGFRHQKKNLSGIDVVVIAKKNIHLKNNSAIVNSLFNHWKQIINA